MSTSSRQKDGGGDTEVAQSPPEFSTDPTHQQNHPEDEAEEEGSEQSKSKNAIEGASQEQALGETGDTEVMQGHPAIQEQALAYETEVKEQDRWLPIANVARIMKTALPDNAKIAKDAKECMQECVSEFISFITSEAAEKCQLEKRKTVNGEDILFAMGSLGFENYSEALKIYLTRYRETNLTKSEAQHQNRPTSGYGSSSNVDGVRPGRSGQPGEEEDSGAGPPGTIPSGPEPSADGRAAGGPGGSASVGLGPPPPSFVGSQEMYSTGVVGQNGSADAQY